jgi:hypothetical protein
VLNKSKRGETGNLNSLSGSIGGRLLKITWLSSHSMRRYYQIRLSSNRMDCVLVDYIPSDLNYIEMPDGHFNVAVHAGRKFDLFEWRQ